METTRKNRLAEEWRTEFGFFKANATRRKERKAIVCLYSRDGAVKYEEGEIFVEFLQYFSSLFSSQLDEGSVNWNEEMSDLQPKVSNEMNAKLNEPYTEEDIRRALFEMIPRKLLVWMGFQQFFTRDFGTWRRVMCARKFFLF